jgi:hypothetical protein
VVALTNVTSFDFVSKRVATLEYKPAVGGVLLSQLRVHYIDGCGAAVHRSECRDCGFRALLLCGVWRRPVKARETLGMDDEQAS